MNELVQRAKDGDKQALSKIERITELETQMSLETRVTKQSLLWAMRRNPDSIFVPILLKAYEKDTDKSMMRYLLTCFTQHYEFQKDVFIELFEERLEDSRDSLELDLISSRYVGRLIHDDDIARFFTLLDRLSNKNAEENLMKYLALKKGGSFYKDAFQPYQVLYNSFPPCKLEKISFQAFELAKIAVLSDNLNDERKKILLDALSNKEGIYWTLLGLLREEDGDINEILLDWVDKAPPKFDRYKPFASMKLRGQDASLDLIEKTVMGSPGDCKRCLYIISNIVKMNHRGEEVPKEIEAFAQWIVKEALVDTFKLTNLLGESQKIRVPDLSSVLGSDTTYISFANISIKPFNVPGKNIIIARDETHFNNLRNSTSKNWGLSIHFKWYKDWVLVSISSRQPGLPREVVIKGKKVRLFPVGLGGGFQEFLIKRVNGDWRLATILSGVIS